MHWLRAHRGQHFSKRRRNLLLVGMIMIGAAWLVTASVTALLRPPSLADARSALKQGDFRKAFLLSQQILQSDPRSKDAQLVAGHAALASGEQTVALRLFRGIGDDGSRQSMEAMLQCGQIAEKLGQLTEAEGFYRSLLRHQADHPVANQRLLNLLRIEGRNWEARPAIHRLLRQRQFVFEYLALAGPLEAVWLSADRDVPYLEFCGRADPEDLLYLLGPIRSVMMEDNDLEKARQGLRRIVAWNPHLLEAQAALGQLLLNSGEDQQFLAWHSQLPETADQHPSIWFTRARWARVQSQRRAAIRCLWEAIRIDPNDRAANLLMANLLTELGDHDRAGVFQQRGEDLEAFDTLLMWGDLQEVAPQQRWPKMIELLERLGRLWEARGWSELLLSVDSESSFARAAIARLDSRLAPQTPLTLTSANPASTIDYSEFPLPDLSATTDLARREKSESAISFADAAQQTGVDFNYFADKQRLAKRVYTFDFAGGGVGVVDFDQDGWQDLYLTQSRTWPPTDATDEQPVHRNRLFRNHRGRFFEDVTHLSGVGDDGFGNGVAVGDVDGDGFSDLYVNNLGRNRLYRNNGDGTFTDWTEASGTGGDGYSLSAVFVDLNRDGLPELYVVNYLDGDAMTRQCQRDGRLIQCSPLKFPGQQDRLYLNLGDGRFRDVTHESGILDPAGIGKGMDVIAANLDGIGGPDLFVANDTTANFLFVNKSEPGSPDVRLEDQGSVTGVAYDELGRVQSSMGVAARDVNQDGLIDLFVTNFYRERNNLFVQTKGLATLLFSDRALVSNLGEPSFLTMGWGTQFLDADLDGDWDLAVANGYLDENTAGTVNDAMRPQFFENQGDARFHELMADQLGPYFASSYFGRAIAHLDWNRDGLEDLCITHMETPVAMLQNTSQRRGRFAAIQLRGVRSSRDAIGSSVHISASGRQWTVQLTAGGGFESASQQQILVGLGDCESIDQLTVRWPDDSEQTFHELPVDRELVLVQGRADPVVHRPRPEVSPAK